MSTWWGIMAPKATPPQITQLLNAKLREAFAEPETVESLGKLGIVVRNEPIEMFANFIQAEIAVWGKIAKHVGISGK
jgi:tripartite-type tricarboxylate transporter receptor subunit TctC